MEFGTPEILRRAAVGWLRRNCSSSLIIEELDPCFGGCRIDAAAVKDDAITAVVIPSAGAIMELQSRVDVTKHVAERVYVLTTRDNLEFTRAHAPAEAGVLVYDFETSEVSAECAARRNLVDSRALARMLKIEELQDLTKAQIYEYLELCRQLLDTRSARQVAADVCATVRRRYEPRSFAPREAQEPKRAGRRYLGMVAGSVFAVMASLGLFTDAQAQTISGRASVVDGDTLKINGERVRIWGIDAFERDQTCEKGGEVYNCGGRALGELAAFVGFSQVTCQAVDKDRYGRSVARCSVGGRDLGDHMVRSGWALDFSHYSNGAYKAVEIEARVKRRGAFAGTFTAPGDYRKTARAEAILAGTTKPAGPGCRIKGNVSSKGARIYHVPGQADYEKTRISEAHGDQWFCTTAEAKANGFRPAAR